jgi:membrane protein YqaA with SNARE-associated domain
LSYIVVHFERVVNTERMSRFERMEWAGLLFWGLAAAGVVVAVAAGLARALLWVLGVFD